MGKEIKKYNYLYYVLLFICWLMNGEKLLWAQALPSNVTILITGQGGTLLTEFEKGADPTNLSITPLQELNAALSTSALPNPVVVEDDINHLAIVTMPFEEYVKGVVLAESAWLQDITTNEAQAVAVRSFTRSSKGLPTVQPTVTINGENYSYDMNDQAGHGQAYAPAHGCCKKDGVQQFDVTSDMDVVTNEVDQGIPVSVFAIR